MVLMVAEIEFLNSKPVSKDFLYEVPLEHRKLEHTRFQARVLIGFSARNSGAAARILQNGVNFSALSLNREPLKPKTLKPLKPAARKIQKTLNI